MKTFSPTVDTIAKPCNHRNCKYYFDIIIITELNSSDILITHKVYYRLFVYCPWISIL